MSGGRRQRRRAAPRVCPCLRRCAARWRAPCSANTRAPPLARRPPSKEELAARTPQVVRCDEAMRAVTLTQQVPGSKAAQQTRTYHFDKVMGEMS